MVAGYHHFGKHPYVLFLMFFWTSISRFFYPFVASPSEGPPVTSSPQILRAPATAKASRALAGGLRLVTEGYSAAPPLPPTPGAHLGITSDPPEPL